MKLDGYTRLAAVVANPIKHSISPFIHNRAFEATAINGAYVAWEIEAGDLAETVANIRRYQMFGINLSMPYKEQVIPYLDELSDEARLIGAVNTVVNHNGTLIGYNTDGKGFFKSLPSFTISDKKMTILGAGGAAKSILAQAILDGASQISVFVENRPGRLADITAVLAKNSIDIRALSVADTSDYGILRLIVNDPKAAVEALRSEGMTASATQVLGIIIPDEPGGLARAIKVLSDEQISVEYAYAFITPSVGNAYVIIRVEDNDKASEILKGAGIELIEQDDIFKK